MKEITTDATEFGKGNQQALRISLTWLELVVSFFLLAVISGYLVEAFALPSPYNKKSVGAGEFPIIIGIATLIPLLLLMALSLSKLIRNVEPQYVTISRPLGVVSAMGILIVQTLLLDKVGLIIGIAVFSALLMLSAGERRPAFFIGVPMALSLGMHAVFVLVLGVYFS